MDYVTLTDGGVYDNLGLVQESFNLTLNAFGTGQGEYHLPEDLQPGDRVRIPHFFRANGPQHQQPGPGVEPQQVQFSSSMSSISSSFSIALTDIPRALAVAFEEHPGKYVYCFTVNL